MYNDCDTDSGVVNFGTVSMCIMLCASGIPSCISNHASMFGGCIYRGGWYCGGLEADHYASPGPCMFGPFVHWQYSYFTIMLDTYSI